MYIDQGGPRDTPGCPPARPWPAAACWGGLAPRCVSLAPSSLPRGTELSPARPRSLPSSHSLHQAVSKLFPNTDFCPAQRAHSVPKRSEHRSRRSVCKPGARAPFLRRFARAGGQKSRAGLPPLQLARTCQPGHRLRRSAPDRSRSRRIQILLLLTPHSAPSAGQMADLPKWRGAAAARAARLPTPAAPSHTHAMDVSEASNHRRCRRPLRLEHEIPGWHPANQPEPA